MLLYFRKAETETYNIDAVDSRGFEVIEDDADTAWSRWDMALAQEQASKLGLGLIGQPLPSIHGTAPEYVGRAGEFTKPMALEDLSFEQRRTRALLVVEEHHPRVAMSIRTLWGYQECIQYVNKMILEGHDPQGRARAGFNVLAAKAMLELTEVHDAMFGSVESSRSARARTEEGWTLPV